MKEKKKNRLTLSVLIKEAKKFSEQISEEPIKELYNKADGKTIGTFIEKNFKSYLSDKYIIEKGSSARGLDFPSDEILTDIKATSVKKPQSSSSFKSAKQKIFGLGYNLLVFIYVKRDIPKTKTTNLSIVSCYFVSKERTSDYEITFRLREMLDAGANKQAIETYLQNKKIPAEGTILSDLVDQIVDLGVEQGYLTMPNAMQWRLQYQKITTLSKKIKGITTLVKNDSVK